MLKTIGERLKEYRKEKNIKVTDFSNMIGVSQGTLSGLENDKSKPSADTLANLVRNTDINIGWLLTGEGQIDTKQQLGLIENQKTQSRPEQSFDSLGMAEGMSLLAKIYSSGDTTYVRAINANLAAFGEAIDNKVIARDTVRMMDEMKNHLQSLENRIMVLEKENAELAKIGEMRKAAANE